MVLGPSRRIEDDRENSARHLHPGYPGVSNRYPSTKRHQIRVVGPSLAPRRTEKNNSRKVILYVPSGIEFSAASHKSRRNMDYKKVFSEIAGELPKIENAGKVASYIPELKRVNPEKFGIHLATVNGEHFGLGDSEEKFSIKSIAKVLSLTMAFELEDDALWKRVGVEPSGSPFNSLVQLDMKKEFRAIRSSTPVRWLFVIFWSAD